MESKTKKNEGATYQPFIGIGICLLDPHPIWVERIIPFVADVAIGHKVAFLTVRRHYIHEARGKLVRKALELGCSHVLFIDDDTIPPMGCIEQLLLDNLAVVGAYVRQRNWPHLPMNIVEMNDGTGAIGCGLCDLETSTIIHSDGMHLACTLIKQQVFKDIWKNYPTDTNPWFSSHTSKWGEDVIFSRRAREAGHDIYCDARIQCDHLGDPLIVNEETYPLLVEFEKLFGRGEGMIREQIKE